MSKHQRNAHFHLPFFIRQQFWPLFIPSIAILFLTFFPQISQSIRINNNENPDRTVAKLGPRDIQIKTTLSPLPLSIPIPSSATAFQDSIGHTLYVISLDGKITAIDAQANGRQLWTADTGSALVDSSLSKIEISRDSRSIRLIPSLIGGLYEKYDEDGHIEPLPFDADALLDASFKLHDELVITGGKHIDTLGLDLHTGQVLYSFSKDDSKQQNTLDNNRTTTTADTNDQGPTLIIKRTTQTVRARNARSGYEKWNFSVSNHHLFHLRTQAASVVLGEVDAHLEDDETTFPGYFEYQLQTGVVLAFDEVGRPVWSSVINAPIAAVWEFKNGQLNEKSLFETTTSNPFPDVDLDEEDTISAPPISRRLAFIGEFNSTPYVIVSPSVQKQLIDDARKNNVAGNIGIKRPVLSSWHKAYQKRTLSVGAELPGNDNGQNANTPSSDSHYPLALRPDPTANPHSHLSSIVETCDTAGYLELIPNTNENFLTETSIMHFNTHADTYIPNNTLTISTVFLGAVIIILIWYFKQRQTVYLSQASVTSESSVCINITPPPTPEYHQIEQPSTPPFQSRYFVEYEHVRFLGRGGFGVVFEAINKLDERRVAIKRVSLKKASGKERALKEIRYLAVLNHPNLIQYYYAWNESPPTGWQEEEDKLLLVRDSANKRDSLSTFPTTGNDSASINQGRSAGVSSVSAVHIAKPSATSPPLSFEITFDRSSHPLLINENFSANSSNQNEASESSSSSSFDQQLDANNNTKSTTKSSLSSSSPLFDHSSDSSNEKNPLKKERTESDDGIVFLDDEQPPSSVSPIPVPTKTIANEKEIPTANFYFVMELCQPESLRDRLIQRMIDPHQAWSIFDQIIKGIEYIHSQKLIHRDLKPSNILFSMDNTVKIGDFGLVSAFGDEKLAKKIKRDDEIFDQIETMSLTSDACGNHEHGGTILYMSPEQINRQPYNQKVDIYAMGIILFELLYPFSTQMERMQSIANVRLQPPVFPKDFEIEGDNRSQKICRLISWLLSDIPRNRPRASDLRQDTFYQRLVQCEAPHLICSVYRQQSQTIVNGQDQAPVSQQRVRISSSSPFRRTVSSSALHSHKDSESGDMECVS